MSGTAVSLLQRFLPARSQPRFVVLHIPKTAGTSLHSSLAACLGEDAISPLFDHAAFASASLRRLRRYQVVQGHLAFTEAFEAFPERSFITFLREPCERCLSWYYYLRRLPLERPLPLSEIKGENSAREAISLAKQLKPEDFFGSDHPHVLQNVLDRQTYQLGDRIPVLERNSDRAAVLASAIANLQRIKFVGLQEHYEADLRRLTGWLGKPLVNEQQASNVTAGRPVARDLPQTVLRQLRRLNEMDLELYAKAQHEYSRGDE